MIRHILFLMVGFPLLADAQDSTRAYRIDFDAYRVNNGAVVVGDNRSMFKKLLNQQFSNLITGQTKNSIGNFASLDLTDGKVDFAGNIISNKGSVFTAKASGAVSDGIFSLFNNSTLNTQFSLDLQYNFMTLSKQRLEYDADSADIYNQQIDKIKFDFEEKFIAFSRRREFVQLNMTLETQT